MKARRNLFVRFRAFFWLLAGAWTACITASLLWNLAERKEHSLQMARLTAQVTFDNDVLYRRWSARHGGVYVRVSDHTPPNPYLRVPERDVTTTSGLSLTLVNPAYMSRQVNSMAGNSGNRGHLTSLRPIRPENMPDPWEATALRSFEGGVKEVSSIETLAGGEHLRLMRPFVTERNCLKCHESQGYRVGDIRGGISVTVPMAPYRAMERPATAKLTVAHLGLWLVGLTGLGLFRRNLGLEMAARETADEDLRRLNATLEERVLEQTAEISQANATLEQRVAERAADLEAAIIELEDSRRAAINLLEDAQAARRQMEEAAKSLRESEEQFRTLADTIPQLCWMTNVDGWIFWYNKRWYEYTGTTPEQMEGWGWKSVHHPDHIERVVDNWTRALKKQETWEDTFPLRSADGEYGWFLSRAFPIRNDKGEIVRWFGTNTNISAIKKAEEEIRKSLHEKEVLLKEVHHRVKNNLQVISSLVSLQAGGSNDETVRGVLNDVTDRVRSMALVHEKLYQSTDLAHIDFAAYSRGLLNYLWRAHGAVADSIRLNVEVTPVKLSVDTAVPLGLILNELAGNSLKHAFKGRDGGEVKVSLRTGEDGRITLTVADDGVGLPEGLDWRQASSLGLRLMQMLAKQIGADVEAVSAGGTRFEIVIG